MIKTQIIILNAFVIDLPIYICHNIPDEYIVQKQLPVVFFRPTTLLKRDSNTGVLEFSNEHSKILKNTYFEKYLRMAASDSSYILN